MKTRLSKNGRQRRVERRKRQLTIHFADRRSEDVRNGRRTKPVDPKKRPQG